MRRKLIETDQIECVLGLGANLFYNSPMEACVIICRTRKPEERRGKILFINAVNEVTRERAQSFLTEANQKKILDSYAKFTDVEEFSRVVTLDEIKQTNGNLNIPLYVRARQTNLGNTVEGERQTLEQVIGKWIDSSADLKISMQKLFAALGENDL